MQINPSEYCRITMEEKKRSEIANDMNEKIYIEYKYEFFISLEMFH